MPVVCRAEFARLFFLRTLCLRKKDAPGARSALSPERGRKVVPALFSFAFSVSEKALVASPGMPFSQSAPAPAGDKGQAGESPAEKFCGKESLFAKGKSGGRFARAARFVGGRNFRPGASGKGTGFFRTGGQGAAEEGDKRRRRPRPESARIYFCARKGRYLRVRPAFVSLHGRRGKSPSAREKTPERAFGK